MKRHICRNMYRSVSTIAQLNKNKCVWIYRKCKLMY